MAWLASCGEEGADTVRPAVPDGALPPGDNGPVEEVVPVPEPDWAVPYAPPEARMRRLTVDQYRTAVRDVFGPSLILTSSLEPDLRIDGYVSVGSAESTVSPRGIELYEAAAFAVARQVWDPASDVLRAPWLDCALAESGAPGACGRSFLAKAGRRLWRRPLSSAELDRWQAVADDAAQVLGGARAGMEYALAGLLTSPHFLYRVELGEPDPAVAGRWRFTDLEMASRLSFLLWNAPPDESLLQAAEAGELTEDDALAGHVARMLDDPRARQGVRATVSEALELHLLDRLSKDPTLFPHMSTTLGASAREETLHLVEWVVFEQDADFRDLLTTRTTFLNRELAALYDVRAPSLEGFAQTELPGEVPRVGLLGHVSMLAPHAHPVASSPTLRGYFIRTRLLCETLGGPPADVDTAIPPPTGTTPTLRDRVAEHLEVESCAGCHNLIDPLGLALETFDGIGRYRTTENGAQIDASGDLDGVMFDDAEGLALSVREHPRFASCMVRHLVRHANGRVETQGERALIREIGHAFARGGYRWRTLLTAFVLSDAFRTVGAVETTPQEETP
jgi:hypothetical protein